MAKKQKLSDEQIMNLIAPSVEKFKRDFPEWDENATKRVVEMMRPYSPKQIQRICLVLAKTPLIDKVVQHRAKFGATTVISSEAKAELSEEVLNETGDAIIVSDDKEAKENVKEEETETGT